MAVVGIALLTLVPGQLGGSETYVRELLGGLAAAGELEYRVVLPPAAAALSTGLPSEVATEYRNAHGVPGRLLAMTEAAARPGPLRARLRGADVVHYPLTIRLPPVDAPTVVTLHDLQHVDLPQMFGRAERAFRAIAWHSSIRDANRVVVPSEFVRGRAVAKLALDPARVDVVRSGVDHGRFTPANVEREPFLLYPARRWPHKNHDRLFAAFAQLRSRRPELRLVLTGDPQRGAPRDGVEERGLVPADELVGLYRRASALVFPSLYEGFGQPVLEAMACGCPVACSDAGALPEVVGDAARLFDPRDTDAIAGAAEEVLDAPADWAARGLDRAAGFSWTATARGYDALYRELSSRS
ncbi:MAG TPA: glycosyltransferase family 1 protein [Gaiellaceae bacterium]